MNDRAKRRPSSPYPYLVYLLFLLFQPLFDPSTTALTWWMSGALVVVFVPIYLWTCAHLEDRPYLAAEGRRQLGGLWGVVGMLALGVAGTTFNSGAGTFFIYAAVTVGVLRPRKRAAAWVAGALGATLLAVPLSTAPFPYSLWAFGPVFILVPALGIAGIAEAERRRTNLRLRMAQGEIEQLAAVAERERIGRDLHDLLGHTLSTITLKAELAAKLLERDATLAAAEMRDVERISREALAQVRAAVRGYRSSGLLGEVANTKLALDASGVEFDYFIETLSLPADRETVLALALREAVTNVVRHAGAKRCAVNIRAEGSTVLLQVDDDGSGGAKPDGNGLSTMRARLETVGGTLHVEALAPGTRIEVTLPIEPSPRAVMPQAVPAT